MQVAPRSATARPFLLDSNAYDPIVDTPGIAELVTAACDAGQIELLLTHVQNQELMADAKRRDRTLALPPVVTPTYGVILDTSVPGLAQVGEVEKIAAIRSPMGGHTHDALLATTAQHQGATLVTNDDRLFSFAKREAIAVWRSDEFIDYVRNLRS